MSKAPVERGARGTLFVVSTPIGNLGDFSARAIETLNAVALIIAEDTRHSRTLLSHHGISTAMSAYHDHNEAQATPKLIARLEAGDDIALISDAGTPLLSDPGAGLVRAAAAAGIRIVPIPGASALLSALVASALPLERFTYFGFAERKGAARQALIGEVVASMHTSVLYEAPGRVGSLLADLREAGAGDRASVVARELTKQFEEVVRGTVAELAERFADDAPRGEVVLVVAGGTLPAAASDEELRARAKALRSEGLSARDVARVLSIDMGASRNTAYRIAHE